MKNKYIFFGDENSINLEIICKSINRLKNQVKYIIIGNKNLISTELLKLKSNIVINEIIDPYNFDNLDINKLNIFDVQCGKTKVDNLISQINISNILANQTKFDLITMPINKHLFKKKINFNGMTEFLGELNSCNTFMLMKGEVFSIIPITTHISLKVLSNNFEENLSNFFNNIKIIFKNFLKEKFTNVVFLCPNPHCGEKGLVGNEDIILKKYISKLNLKNNSFLLPADSAFNKVKENSLYISTYHDQALIPFKILNKKSFNQTIGLNYKRLSPSHGTAFNIKFKNLADSTSYLQCMLN